LNNRVLYDQPGLRKTNWLESLDVVWPEFSELHDEHADCAQAVLDARAVHCSRRPASQLTGIRLLLSASQVSNVCSEGFSDRATAGSRAPQ